MCCAIAIIYITLAPLSLKFFVVKMLSAYVEIILGLSNANFRVLAPIHRNNHRESVVF